MTEYIITDEDIASWTDISPEHYIIRRIRSRPYQNQREKVLDELELWHNNEIERLQSKPPNIISPLYAIKAHEKSIARLKELRGEQ
jgi:hypothetical protein